MDTATCPFCGATQLAERVAAPAAPSPVARLGRIAVLAAGAALMGSSLSCDDPAQPKSDAGTGGASASGGKGGGGGGSSATGGNDGTGGASATGGNGGDVGTGGTSATGGSGGAPIAIYAAAVALPSNTA